MLTNIYVARIFVYHIYPVVVHINDIKRTHLENQQMLVGIFIQGLK